MATVSNITLPIGASDHGDSRLLCLPAKWTDVVIFFLGNYLAHAATLRSSPGRSMVQSFVAMLEALLVPVSGFRNGLRGVFSLANLAKTDLQVAARAGALLKVIKTDLNALSLREINLNRGLKCNSLILPPNFWYLVLRQR